MGESGRLSERAALALSRRRGTLVVPVDCVLCAQWVHVCAVCLLTRCPSADKIDSTRAQSPSPQEHAPNYIMNVHKLAKVERPANQRALGQTTLARIAAQLI